MPETWEGIKFDKKGVCNICREHEHKKILDWKERNNFFREKCKFFRKKLKDKPFDCLVPYSGGKDSAYTLWAMKYKYGMRPCAVTFSHAMFSDPEGLHNLIQVPRNIGAAHVILEPDFHLVKKMVKIGIKKFGDFCFHCHMGVGSFPLRFAIQSKIPFLVWGEPTAEYQTGGHYKFDDFEEYDPKHNKKVFFAGAKLDDFIGIDGITKADLEIFRMPSQEEYNKLGIWSVPLGNYEPWDIRKHVEIIKRNCGWKTRKIEGCYVNWDNVECKYIGVRDWQKYLKRGFGRSAFRASIDVREGRMTRDEALKIIKKYDGKRPASLDNFLKEMKITEKEFLATTKKHIVPKKG